MLLWTAHGRTGRHLVRPGQRQWVLTIPWPRRFLFARRPEVARGVLDVALRAIFAWYRVRGRDVGVPEGKCGAITVIQRAGSALNLNIHFHTLVLDGVFARDEKTGVPLFHGVRPPTQEEITDLVATIAQRAERWLAKQGFGTDQEDVPVEEDPDDAQVLLMAASMEGRSALRGRRARRKGVPRNPEGLPHRCGAFEGYNLHADTQVPSRDRPGLERLCRYILRPPLAKSRIEETAEGEIRLTMKRPWADGTAEMLFTKQEFLERLCALVPPPRSNSILYHGVLAGHAAMRAEITPKNPVRPRPTRSDIKLIRVEDASEKSRWWVWADLLERVFSSDGFACPRCGRRMHLRAIVIGAPATTETLAGIVAAVQRSTASA